MFGLLGILRVTRQTELLRRNRSYTRTLEIIAVLNLEENLHRIAILIPNVLRASGNETFKNFIELLKFIKQTCELRQRFEILPLIMQRMAKVVTCQVFSPSICSGI